jgi:uncharacterized protein (TIGR02145 family)
LYKNIVILQPQPYKIKTISKLMKAKFIAIIITIFTITATQAQNYQISFTGTGASTNVETVEVENLTQCTSISMNGSNVLNLLGNVGINVINSELDNQIYVYPNPTTGSCLLEFYSTANDEATIGVFDINGRIIVQVHEFLVKGNHSYQLIGLSNGIYTIKIESEKYQYTSKLVSLNDSHEIASIKQIDDNANSIRQSNLSSVNEVKNTESEKSVIAMQYNPGDLLKITGKSGNYSTVFMLVANSSQTVSFTFIPCSDNDGNNYSIVKIGDQWWMAENLNSGTYAAITTPQIWGTKFCMDVNGQADPTCPMGGLYEWGNLLQGTTGCNGTGPPPNDDCSTPIQGLCPNGWHIPSHYEWSTLENNSGSNPGAFPYNTTTVNLLGTDEGGNLKQNCTDYWWDPNQSATNSTGFSGLPGGDTWNGVYEDFGQSAYFWTSTASFFFSWVHALNYSLAVTGRSAYAVESGFSCRCVKDN